VERLNIVSPFRDDRVFSTLKSGRDAACHCHETESDIVAQILIIGYGNSLRGDDAVGCLAAEELRQHYHDNPNVQVIASHQLTPEMAEDISRCDFVIFLDASSSAEPGKIWQAPVLPKAEPAGFTHQLTPASLLSAAEKLYGRVPEAACITLAGWSFKLDNKLSRRAKMLLPVLVGQAKDTVDAHQRRAPQLAPI
jgi:hydrogenase maturation protease